MRRILHIDMDAFFASVEQRDNPALKGKPVIVAGASDNRGVVTTASYEARAYGVHSAMPVMQAKRLCPQGIYVPVRKGVYRTESKIIMGLFRKVTPLVEVLSVDEAFLDVTEQTADVAQAVHLAAAIQRRLFELRQLTCSVGVSYQKFAAKLASDFNKPAGLTVIEERHFKDMVWPLPVGRMMGIGPRSRSFLEAEGLYTIGQLAQVNPLLLQNLLGKRARDIYQRANGLDSRPVIVERDVKSVGREQTFPKDIVSRPILEKILSDLVSDVSRRLRRQNLLAKTVTLKWRLTDFTTHTRQVQLPRATNHFDLLWRAALSLLNECAHGEPWRLVGMTASQLVGEKEADVQLSFFDDAVQKAAKSDRLTGLIKDLQEKYGKDRIMRANALSGHQHEEEGQWR